MDTGPDNEPLASPWNFFPDRKRRVAKPSAEFLGRSLLPFLHFATVDHHIMCAALACFLYPTPNAGTSKASQAF